MTRHARERLARLRIAGVAERVVEALAGRAQRWARGRRSAAVLLVTLPFQVQDQYSNGEQVWAVVRDEVVTTVMFRRASQPATPEAFGVEEVVREVVA